MKNLVDIIQSLCDWLEENVCSQLLLLDPENDTQDEEYEVSRIHPKAYPLFTPWQNANPELAIAGAPGIVVSLLEGIDDITKSTRTIGIQLQLVSWNPGVYGKDIYNPINDAKEIGGKSYYLQIDRQTFERSQEGWKESYLFLETTLKALEETELIHGMRVKMKDGQITFGHYRDDTGPIDLWPYWINYIRFDLEVVRTIRQKPYEKYL